MPPSPSFSGREPEGQQKPPPVVLLVAPLGEGPALKHALRPYGVATRDVATGELLATADEQLGALAARLSRSAKLEAASEGGAAGGDDATAPPRQDGEPEAECAVVGCVMDLEVAGAAAVAQKTRALLAACAEHASRRLGGTGGERATPAMLAIGSPSRALEVGLWPTDVVFTRPLRLEEVTSFLVTAARAVLGDVAVERGETSLVGGPGGGKRSSSPTGDAPSADPPRPTPRGVARSGFPPARRASVRPASSGALDDDLLAMAGADDDDQLQELSADQVGPGGMPIGLGSDIERLLDSAARLTPQSVAGADAPRPAESRGVRLSDDRLRELDDLLRVDDPDAVERRVVAAGSSLPTAVGTEGRSIATARMASDAPDSSPGKEARTDRGGSVASLRQRVVPAPSSSSESRTAHIATESLSDETTHSRRLGGTGATGVGTAIESDRGARDVPPSAASEGSHDSLEDRPPRSASSFPVTAAGASSHTGPEGTWQGPPPDAVELLRRTAAPLASVSATTPLHRAARPRSTAPEERNAASSPRFSEPPPPSEPKTFDHAPWGNVAGAAAAPAVPQDVSAPLAAAHVPEEAGRRRRSPGIAAGEAEDPLRAIGAVIAHRSSGVVVCEAADPERPQGPDSHTGAGSAADRPSERRWIVVRDGDVITVASDCDGESLLDFLVERGELSREAIRPLAPRLPRWGRHAVAALIAYGFLAQDELWLVLRAHAEWILARALQQRTTRCRLEPEIPERLGGEPAVFGGAAGVEVYLETIRRVVAPAEAIRRLGGGRARFFVGDNAALLAEAALPPEVVEAVHGAGGTTLHELLSRFGEGIAPMLLGLFALRVIEAEPRQARAVPASREPAEADPLDAAAIRERVRARLALVREADYFRLLGIAPSATDYEIRRAFLDLRRRFDPSRLLTAATADLHDDVALILDVLQEAYDVLRDPWRRSRYRAAMLETGGS